MFYETTERYLRGEQSHLFEQQSPEFTRIHDSARANDPARDIAIAANGAVWVLKLPEGYGHREAEVENYELFTFDGFDLVRVEGEGVAVSADPDGHPYLVQRDGTILRRTAAGAWETLPGTATDIGVGADGTVWAIGTQEVPGGRQIMRLDGAPGEEAWTVVDGGGIRVAVAPDGEPWVADADGLLWRRLGGRWHRLPHGAIDVAIGADGNVWIAGIEGGKHGGNGVHRWNGRDWDTCDGAAIRLAVTPNGLPWLVNIRGGVYPRHLAR
ncbi:hypothetical protein [Nocardioides bruguierae]|uniref:hypothetical protein n=1 Tax=Nocardioides bruguierae TaxID=2945102 RepID=UPI0020217CB4|nr:hypothetical protein [Nocardioides bruguierae]MCL8024476.1 hypothetical protein [Nocardioides bruguierae]